MSEKELREKVNKARRYLAGFPDHESEVIYQALTALEKRVEELEKERALVEKWAEGYFRLNGYQDLIAMLKEREAPDAE